MIDMYKQRLKNTFHYVKILDPLSFKTLYQNVAMKYIRQVVHARHQTPQEELSANVEYTKGWHFWKNLI